MTCSRPTGLLIVGCIALIVVTTGASAVSTGSTIPSIETQIDEPDANSTHVPHEHPDSAVPTGNPEALEQRLSARLTDRLTQSAVRIDDGEYEAANRSLERGYDEQLVLYLEVYRSTVTDALQAVEEREQLFTETAALQMEYAGTLSEYQEVHAAYETARDNDDRDRAQQRARDLNDLTRELQGIDESLTTRYQVLDETTAVSLETMFTSIGGTTEDITQRTESIVEESYTSTELTAEADAEGSFTDPIRITGQLSAEEEVPPTGNVSFLVNDRAHTESVASDGSFSIQYRPVTEPVGETSLDVVYAPDRSALYLSSSTEVTTTIAQDSPTVSIQNATETAQGTSTVTASGDVSAGGVAAPNASVELYVGDQQLTETRTDDDGEYRFETVLPIDISTGTQTLSVRSGGNETALGPASEESELVVEGTEPALTLSAVRTEGAVTVSGQLLIREEIGVGEQEVSVSLNGEQQQSIQTDPDGNYEAVVELPDEMDESDSVSIQVEFNGSGTNLDDAAISASLSPPGGGPLPDGALTLLGAVGLGLTLVLGGGYGLYRYRRRPESDEGGDTTTPDSIGAEASPLVSPEFDLGVSGADPDSGEQPPGLDPVQRHLEHGDTRTAVLTLYEIVRRELDRGENSPTDHWEFFELTADQLSNEQRSVLRNLTEAFESVRFAGEDPDPDDVTALLNEAERLLPVPDGGSTDGHGGSND